MLAVSSNKISSNNVALHPVHQTDETAICGGWNGHVKTSEPHKVLKICLIILNTRQIWFRCGQKIITNEQNKEKTCCLRFNHLMHKIIKCFIHSFPFKMHNLLFLNRLLSNLWQGCHSHKWPLIIYHIVAIMLEREFFDSNHFS